MGFSRRMSGKCQVASPASCPTSLPAPSATLQVSIHKLAPKSAIKDANWAKVRTNRAAGKQGESGRRYSESGSRSSPKWVPGGCLTHAPKKGQTGARPENSVTCLMKVASVRNANGQGPGRARARQNPDDYFGTTIVYSEVKSLPKRNPAEAEGGGYRLFW